MDLTQSTAKKKSRNIRFLNRVFTPDEQDFILSSSAFPELRLWCCWAAKEAAYKAISKACPDIPAIPKLFPVSIDPEGHEDSGTESPDIQGLFFPRLSAGSVLTPAGRCWIRIEYRHTYLHCLAFTHAPDTLSVFRHVHYLSSSLQGGRAPDTEAGRLAARFYLAGLLSEHFEDLEIVRQQKGSSAAPPRVFCRGRLLDVDISLSHDGLFLAHACLLQPSVP
ncbi:4'-phosphopantetheinyl transferase superfamily protein [Syntrophus sp. (in: bacteria)]|uniref:4'-phosphopantetheinyl transferase superfamily protein n=1 Tax=Syntrophus sp. (in: bacteria) TaxID=48412 RepID=UPI00345EB135